MFSLFERNLRAKERRNANDIEKRTYLNMVQKRLLPRLRARFGEDYDVFISDTESDFGYILDRDVSRNVTCGDWLNSCVDMVNREHTDYVKDLYNEGKTN